LITKFKTILLCDHDQGEGDLFSEHKMLFYDFGQIQIYGEKLKYMAPKFQNIAFKLKYVALNSNIRNQIQINAFLH